MDIFFKTAAGVLLALILILTLSKQERDIAVLMVIAVCCMVAIIAISCLQPIFDFLYRLQSLGGFQENGLRILLKIVGIGFLAEIASMVCNDAGNASLGKVLQIMASVSIFNLSLPLFETLLELVQSVLGEI